MHRSVCAMTSPESGRDTLAVGTSSNVPGGLALARPSGSRRGRRATRHLRQGLTRVLLPRRSSGTVVRRHLLDFLHRHLDRRLQLVSAPPGYGKTTLLVDFAHEARDQGRPVCWLTLDDSDV